MVLLNPNSACIALSEKKKERAVEGFSVERIICPKTFRINVFGESICSQCRNEGVSGRVAIQSEYPLSTLHQSEQHISKQRRLSGILLLRLLLFLLLCPSVILLSPFLKRKISLKNNFQKSVAEILFVFPSNSVFFSYLSLIGGSEDSSFPLHFSPQLGSNTMTNYSIDESSNLYGYLIIVILEPFINISFYVYKMIYAILNEVYKKCEAISLKAHSIQKNNLDRRPPKTLNISVQSPDRTGTDPRGFEPR